MALAAVISLKNTLHRLLNSPRISLPSFTRGILEFAHNRLESLQEALRRYDDRRNCSEGVTATDARIREHVRQLEDAIERHASSQFLDMQENATFSFNEFHPLTLQIHAFVGAAVEMEDEYTIEIFKPSDEEDDAAAPIVPLVYDGGKECEMVGLSDQFIQLRKLLTEGVVSFHDFIFCVGIVGMPGIGKTRLAKKLFHDPLVKASFECRAFVTVGGNWGFGDVLRAIIAQVDLPDKELAMMVGGEIDLVSYLHSCLRGRKFLIMFDGVLDQMLFIQVHAIIPIEHNGSGLLLTSQYETQNFPTVYFYRLRFLNEDESWELLRKMVFGEDEDGEEEKERDCYCPPYLIKTGKKIAEKCEGLPLLILKVAKLLKKDRTNLEYWEEATKKRSSIFEDALNQIYEVLLPGFQSIPKYLQMNFLYLGAFPIDHTITNSEFENLWRAEGFLDIPFFNAFGMLSSCCFIVDRRISTMSGKPKACTLHVAYRHLTKIEAEKNKAFHILSSYEDCVIERIESHRCLVIHENVLFALKEVHDTMASVSTIRSVLCMGPYHQYQVPICSEEWMLLRVLNALTIRFYEFPSTLGKLILLRYLSLTCNANLHFSVSKLWNLQYLIVHPHLSIKRKSLSDSYLPVEIWDLKELLQLQIIGRNLPDPPPGAALPKLIRLLDIGVQSCTKQVLQSVPNLEKLRVQIELGPVATQENLISCFDHISCLHQLKTLQCVIMNPQLVLPEPPITRHPLPVSISTSHLEKLTLKGFGFAWVEMRKLAKLPNLKKLTLQSYAFRGEKWDAKETVFANLLHLCIEDTDLVQWNSDDETFQMLGSIAIKNCYKLREIPLLINCGRIELVDCNPLVEACAKQWCSSVIANYSWK